ncbi:MAG TPA: arginine deiminase family protein [Bryobacteraceae bacterium]|nr:arginine deiminase family protein [Bryobacteraceae bacterium]
MPLTAITRAVSPSISQCQVAFVKRQPIDLAKAIDQHNRYEACLAALGIEIVSLPAAPDLPDAVFVEDPAIILDEVAVMTRMGAESRRGESESLAQAVARFRPLRWITDPGTLEGGDVVRIGAALFVGRSGRSNAAGIAQLERELAPFRYTVQGVELQHCLHLKSACTYLGRGQILANRAWVNLAPFGDCRVIDVAPGEPAAADVLAIDGSVIIPASFPETASILERGGWHVLPVDVSELQKAEAGVTCMSLIFDV